MCIRDRPNPVRKCKLSFTNEWFASVQKSREKIPRNTKKTLRRIETKQEGYISSVFKVMVMMTTVMMIN